MLLHIRYVTLSFQPTAKFMLETIQTAQKILLLLENQRIVPTDSIKAWKKLGKQGFEALAFLFHRKECRQHELILSQLALFPAQLIDKKALFLVCMIGLEHEDHKVREKSVVLLGLHPDVSLTNTLLMAAIDDHNTVRIAAFYAIIQAIDAFYGEELEQALTIFSNGLFDEDQSVRWASAKALYIFLAPTTLPFLRTALNNEQNPQIKGVVAHTLILLGEENLGMPILLVNLSSDNAAVQKQAIQGLGDIGEPETIAMLQAIFKATTHHGRLIEALGSCGDNRIHNWLVELHQRDPSLTSLIMKAIEKLHSHHEAIRCINIIKNQLKTAESPLEREQQLAIAFWQLGNMRGRPTRTFLLNCLSHSSAEIRRVAVLSLFRRQERIGIQNLLLHYLSEKSEKVRMEVLEGIRKYGVPKPRGIICNEVLFLSLIDPTERVCNQGLTTLKALGYPTHFTKRLQAFTETNQQNSNVTE